MRTDNFVDASRVAAAGHSLGAITTLGLTENTYCRDPRLRAAVALSGIQLPHAGTFFSDARLPLLLVHGDKDKVVPFKSSVDAFAAAKAPKFFVSMFGGAHSPFGPPYGEVLARAVVDFLDRYVKDKPEAIDPIRRDTNLPGVAGL